MANARQIVKRRKAIQNIRKITRTMEMVATVRFRRVYELTAGAQPYTDQLTRVAYNLAEALRPDVHHPLLERHDDAPADALVVLTSNRGLAGAYNSGILRMARQQREELAQRGRPVSMYAFGKKASGYLRFHGVAVHRSADQFEGRPDWERVVQLADELSGRFIAGELRTVRVVFMQFVTAGSQRPAALTMLPIERPDFALLETSAAKEQMALSSRGAQYEFMPDRSAVLDTLLPQSLRMRLYQCFLDALASEQVARMTAMRLATEAAEDMIRMLTARYNRARQAQITTELAEIMGGAEALKE